MNESAYIQGNGLRRADNSRRTNHSFSVKAAFAYTIDVVDAFYRVFNLCNDSTKYGFVVGDDCLVAGVMGMGLLRT